MQTPTPLRAVTTITMAVRLWPPTNTTPTPPTSGAQRRSMNSLQHRLSSATRTQQISRQRHNKTLPLQDNGPLEPILPFTVPVRRLSLVPAPVQGCDSPPDAIVDHGITIVPRAACTFPPGSVNSDNTVPTLEDSSTESSTSHLSTTCHQFTSAFSSHSIFQPFARRLRATNIKPLNSTTSVCHYEPPQRGFPSVGR